MPDIIEYIQNRLFELQDTTYRDFHSKLMPTVAKEKVIGVRTPVLRRFAKEVAKRQDIEVFLQDLPHTYYEENNLHMFLLEEMKDYEDCMAYMERFLPYVDNWATCDARPPKVFEKHKESLLAKIKAWIASGETYTIRYGVNLLMRYYLDEDFSAEYPKLVAGIVSEEYYVKMVVAWYFATALAKQYEAVLPFLQEGKLEIWTHNKTIQKAVESYRITPEQKNYLKTLKRKENHGK